MPFDANNNTDVMALVQMILQPISQRQERIETKIDAMGDRLTVIERNQANKPSVVRTELSPLAMLWYSLMALLSVVAIAGLIYVGGGGRFGGG